MAFMMYKGCPLVRCGNDIYYGYRSQGINFLLGATFRF